MTQNKLYVDGTYLKNNPTWHEEDSPWKAGQIAKLLEAGKIRPTTLCEVGCGAGGILNCLADRYGDQVMLSGYEISPQAFEICSKKERKNLRFYLADLLEEKGPTFDVVMAIDVFEHVEDYFGFLRKLRDKGTYKVFHIPLDLSVYSVGRGSPILRARNVAGHIHYFTKETALASLKDTGYEVIDYFYTGSSTDLPAKGRSNLMKLLRKLLFSVHQDLAVKLLGGFSLMVLAK